LSSTSSTSSVAVGISTTTTSLGLYDAYAADIANLAQTKAYIASMSYEELKCMLEMIAEKELELITPAIQYVKKI